jgi:O-acetylserine/cysteine efflux transporter
MARVTLRDSLLATLVAVIWGFNFVVISWGMEGFPPLLFLAIRFIAVLLPAVMFVARPAVPLRDVLVVGVFMSLGQFGLLYTSLHLGMPAGIASLVLQAQVLLTVGLAALRLGERPTRLQLAGITVGTSGLMVVALGRDAATPPMALVVCLGAALSWAVGNVVSRRAGVASGLSMTVWSALVVPVPLLLLSLVIDGPEAVGTAITHFSLRNGLSTAYTAMLASLVGYGIWNSLLARHATSAVVPFVLLVPPVGIVSAWLALGEVPNGAEVAGGAVLMLGVAITLLRRRSSAGTSPEIVSGTRGDEMPCGAGVSGSTVGGRL